MEARRNGPLAVDGLVMTAHKAEVGLEQQQKLKLEFGLSVVM